ncbi:hypothetical protein KUW19_00915 [Ferrimonas balearica]|uniref:hypothetical protein n=1 Tax=Ferrimonas balearica TaxID=44012 RepID=UPI001C95E0A1|nr:hypothetical protein [Ferrimonas balearica]MBY6105038.1 hypothetical protein [Ferrimonas balearica]
MDDELILRALHAADAAEATDPNPRFLFEVGVLLLERAINSPEFSEEERADLRDEVTECLYGR